MCMHFDDQPRQMMVLERNILRWDGCWLQKPKATNGKIRWMNLNFNDDQFNRRLRWFWVVLLLIRMRLRSWLDKSTSATNKRGFVPPSPHRTARTKFWQILPPFLLRRNSVMIIQSTNLGRRAPKLSADASENVLKPPYEGACKSQLDNFSRKGPMKRTWQTLMANNWTAFENSIGFEEKPLRLTKGWTWGRRSCNMYEL